MSCAALLTAVAGRQRETSKSMDANVGDLQVVQTQSLILPEGQDGWIGFTIQGWEVKLRVQLATDETSNQGLIALREENDGALLRLINWSNALGTATVKPLLFATLDSGDRVHLMVTHWRIGSVNRLDLQFLLEAK